ncbi:MAG TPA: POTRA domain-containing protein, partial [Burkholderiaceae bacterium]|nr:POTRA domain-containing protein [Burkholderiaceae bacterium]
MFKDICRIGGAVALGLIPSIAFAQAIPAPALPGRIEQEIQRPPEPRPAPDVVPIPAERFPEQVPPGAQDVVFTLRRVDLVGNRALSTETLSAEWADRIGQQIRLSDVFAIASALTARYRREGYILSQVIVPKQEIRTGEGVVRLQVLEGHIANVTFNAPGLDVRALQPYAAPIVAERPLSLGTLERSLLLLNELPGVTARANLRPSAVPEASDLEVNVAQQRRVFSVGLHNRGGHALGPQRLDALADFRGVLSDFDRHHLRLLSSLNNRLNLLAYGGEMPVGASGLRALWALSHSRAVPRTGLPARIDTDSTSLSIGASYPIIRSRELGLAARAALTAYDGESDLAGLPITRDKLRALRIGLTWDAVDDLLGLNLVDVEYAHGLSGLGASSRTDPEVMAAGTNPQFRKTTIYAARLQSLGGAWSVLLAATAQHSSD